MSERCPSCYGSGERRDGWDRKKTIMLCKPCKGLGYLDPPNFEVAVRFTGLECPVCYIGDASRMYGGLCEDCWADHEMFLEYGDEFVDGNKRLLVRDAAVL